MSATYAKRSDDRVCFSTHDLTAGADFGSVLWCRGMPSPPLTGTLVVALEQAVAVPFATRQLADLGARVIKIERPAGGDFARGYDTTVRGLSSHFVWLNRGKESLALDLKRPEAQLVLSRLLERADVFVQNLAPGAAERLDLGAETLRRKYPRLIACSLTGYGSSGRCDLEAGMAKLFATETAAEVSLEAMRIMGGNGFSKDFPVERYYRDAPLLVIGGGTNELQRLIIARQLLQKYAI